MSAARPSEQPLVHASCAAFRRSDGDGDWAAALIRGPSGAGKSTLALRLVALGARLVADDQVAVRAEERGGERRLIAEAPERLKGLIEARGVGLMRLPPLDAAPLACVVDLVMAPPERRLPPLAREAFDGVDLPVLRLVEGDRAAATLCCLLRDGALLDPATGLADLGGGAAGLIGDLPI